MNGKSTTSTGPEKDFARDDAPRLTPEIAERAQLAVGDRIIREARPRGRPPKPIGQRKEAVSLRLSPGVLAHFRSTGDGWQTRIDEALQAFVNARIVGQGGINAGRQARSVHEEPGRFEHRGKAPSRKRAT